LLTLSSVTQGNHTATQALFGSPCEPAQDINSTIKGFNSGFIDIKNGSKARTFDVNIKSSATLWFFDFNTCGSGGVGSINSNEDANSTETLAGFTVCFSVVLVPVYYSKLTPPSSATL
jgi:hypothetical protein